MDKQVIKVPELFSYSNYGFEQCVALGNLIFITGQAGIDKEGIPVSDTIEGQAEMTFNNIRYALEAAGSDLSKILAMTCFIVDIPKNGPPFWAIRKKMIPVTSYTSASIGIACLADPVLLLEIQCTAFF